jgi:BlaI family transcriptional regulator, penicillinase repressor
MPGAKSPRKPLSELEHLVMDVIWKRSSGTAEDVREALASTHPMKDSTARTVLKRLEEKGYLAHQVEGRTNIYRGLTAPKHVAVRAVRQIIDRFCGGSIEQLLVGMVDDKVLDEQELQRLTKKIVRLRARKEES